MLVQNEQGSLKRTRSPNPARRRTRSVKLLICSLLSTVVLPCLAANNPGPQNPSATQDAAALLLTPPHAWIVDVAANEIRAIQSRDPYLRYRVHTRDQKGDRVRDVIESKDGTVGRTILKDGRPLTAEEDLAERDRLNGLVNSPSEFAKHIHNDSTGKTLAVDLVRLMPDAMIYTYTPGQPQINSPVAPHQIVIDYKPNPAWSPPNTTAEALTGLRGRMWIDPQTRDLLRMEGEVFHGVNFGWGMLAHIYPGGKLALDQVNAGGDRWMFSHFVQDMRVRALMVKTLSLNTTVDASGFHTLPTPLTYQEAIHLLLADPVAPN